MIVEYDERIENEKCKVERATCTAELEEQYDRDVEDSFVCIGASRTYPALQCEISTFWPTSFGPLCSSIQHSRLDLNRTQKVTAVYKECLFRSIYV